MARLITRDGSSRTKPVEVLSRADVDALGLGKKWSVSLDGGITFQPYREVRDVDWAAFFAPSPGSSNASPSAAPREVPRTVAVATEERATPNDGIASLEARVRAIDASLRELSNTPFVRGGDLDGVRRELRGEVETIQTRLRVLSDGELGAYVERAAEPVVARIEQKLARVQQAYARLDDLAEEQVESVQRYRPGTIDALRQQLAAEREECDRLRAQVRSRDQSLDAREAEVAKLRAAEGAVDPSQIERMRGDLARLRGELDERVRVEAERDDLARAVKELEAQRARWEVAQRAEEADLEARRALEEIRGERETLEAEVDELRGRVERLEASRKDLRERLDRRNEQLKSSQEHTRKARETCADLEQSVAALTAERDELRATREGALTRAAEAEERYAALARQLESDAQRKHAALETAYTHRREAMRAELEREWERERAELGRRLQSAERERDAERKRAAHWEAENAALAREVFEARDEQRRWRADDAERAARIREQEVRRDALREECERAERQRDGERDAWEQQRDAESTLRAKARQEHEELTARVAARRAELDAVEQRLHRGREDAGVERDLRVAILETPWFGDAREASQEADSEARWLEGVRERIASAGFQFSRRLVESFHTSLKIAAWAPLTVLAGVSGTGKSELPRLYSLYGGLRFLPLPVQPNWDSPQDLFGFFDYVGGRFRATPLVRAMVQSLRPVADGGFDDALLLVLLDEMNLARVELYFSELLSRLETRRGLDRDQARQQCAIGIDLGAGVEEYSLPLQENVLWVGTMNEDESTHTLSDKVLDRGNVMMFPRPRELHVRDEVDLGHGAPALPRRTWTRWQRSPERSLPQGVRDEMRGELKLVNDALARVQRGVGHRVMQAIERYVANHPRVCGARRDELSSEQWRVPFEDQLVQKVMPKLRGVSVDSREGRACLDAVQELLTRAAPGLCEDFLLARESAQGAFVWNQASYLDVAGE